MGKAPETLADLVAPLPEDEFVTLLRERRLTLTRGAGRDRYSELMNWRGLLDLIRQGRHPINFSEFSLVMDSKMAPPDRWWKKNPEGEGNVVNLPNLLEFMRAGFSLTYYGLETYEPRLKVLCDNIRSRLREQVKIGAIVTMNRPSAFTLHYDPEDLLILQVEGRKRWKIFGPPVVNPLVGIAPPAPPPEDTLILDEVLEPGDFLFLPAGYWHRCENQSDRSLHLGVFLQPPSGLDIVKAITSQLLSDDQFRMPLTRFDGSFDLEAVEVEIKNRALEQIAKLDLKEFLAEFERQS